MNDRFFTTFLRMVKLAGVNLCVLVLMLACLEGLASITVFVLGFFQDQPPRVAERFHTRYDPDLGWVNKPGTRINDFYGPGKHMIINSKGMRGEREITDTVQPGKVRIVCSGDSFTLGYGVGQEAPWCEQLTLLNRNIEPVNMGQGGYGIDQSYLWYMRDGKPLAHSIHIFAFIGTDFRRMLQDNLEGYGKPLLALQGDRLVTHNTPVPRTPYRFEWLAQNRNRLSNLMLVQLMTKVFKKTSATEQHKEAIVEKVFSDLVRVNAEKNSSVVFVWLPNVGNEEFDDVRSGVSQLCARNSWNFIDLTSVLEREGDRLFIPPGAADSSFLYFAGHYSEEGNRIIARELYHRMLAIPELATRLSRSPR